MLGLWKVTKQKVGQCWAGLSLATLLLSGCQPIQSTVAASAAAAPTIPLITIKVTADGITIPAETPAGIVAVTVANEGGAPGMPELARLNDGVTLEQFTAALEQGPEVALTQVMMLGATERQPGEQIVYDMPPGDYVAVQFVENGPPLIGSFTAGAPSGAAAPSADVTAQLADFAFILPDSVKAGKQRWLIQNTGKQWHEMGIVKLAEGVTVASMLEILAAAGPEGPAGPPPFEPVAFWSPMGAGAQAWVELDLPPGEYTVVCFLPDLSSTEGTPHLAHGMVRTLTVTE